ADGRAGASWQNQAVLRNGVVHVDQTRARSNGSRVRARIYCYGVHACYVDNQPCTGRIARVRMTAGAGSERYVKASRESQAALYICWRGAIGDSCWQDVIKARAKELARGCILRVTGAYQHPLQTAGER